MNETLTEFPVWGLLPKRETGVSQFLAKHPEYDGRGIVMAIFDSGVDPGAPGLQTTTDGKVKVIERYDCSGSGDVDTSTVVTTPNGTVKGLTGRDLIIPKTWNNPSGEYHIGLKNAFELYPLKLQERIKQERKEKLWDPRHKAAIANASRKLESVSNNVETLSEKLSKEDREAELEILNLIERKFNDVGPTYDCVVFHDGTCWRACIDTTETGDLSQGVFLGEYTLTHEFAPLTEQDQLNISINVYDNGNVLEIVSMCSPHGTHVASIASAHFPDEPEKNGVAPGAQIISLSIGDIRLISMETGTALVRAMVKIMQRTLNNPVHVINMSYGEHAHWSSSGRVGELMVEVVDKHNVTWVVSAGNHGPALSTVSTPPDINTDCLIGVGAYVSPDMMAAEYAMLEKLPGMPYTWSSRGPTPDGGWGLSVCAPGGAITSVPNFLLRSAQLMNGTSMAAPHVTGAVALLMSGLKQKGLPYSPHSIKRALENTALFLQNVDEFAQGYGLLQVEKAFENLCTYHNVAERNVRFSCECGSQNSKGIYTRCGPLDRPKEWLVTVNPLFHENAEKRSLIDFNLRLSLVWSAPWVQAPANLDMTNLSRSFTIRIDPAGLSEGVHTTNIRAYDLSDPAKGPVFRIPVTAVKPLLVTSEGKHDFQERGVLFKPGAIRRNFILVPERATWAVLTLRTMEKDRTGKFMVHCLQLLPRQVCKTMEFHKMFLLSSKSDVTCAFSCRGGVILEVAIAKFWSSLQQMEIEYELEFRGARPDQHGITMQGCDGIHTLELSAGIRTEEIVPSISLKNSVLVLRPTESKILTCCRERDVIPPSRQIYETVLTYSFNVSKNCEVTPHCPILCELLYESEFESQLWMLYDQCKQLIAVGDAYPSKYSIKLDKGDYTIKLDVRHEKKELLEKLSDTPLLLSQKLCQPVSLDVYISQSQAMIQGKKMASAVIPPGHHILPMYIGPLNNEKSGNKNLPFGHYLSGSITFAKDELGKKVEQYKFKYVLPEPPNKKKAESKEKEKTKSEEFEDAMRDFGISWLAKLEPGEKATEWYEKLKADHPGNLQVHTAMLNCIQQNDYKKFGVLPFVKLDADDTIKAEELSKTCKTVIEICNEIINVIDVPQLLAQLAVKNDTRPDSSKLKQNAEKQKSALVEALSKKGAAQARLLALEAGDGVETGQLDDIWREIVKFIEPNDLKVAIFMLWHAFVSRHYARAGRILMRLSEDRPCRELDTALIDLFTTKFEGFSHIGEFMQSWMPYKFPSGYRKF